MSSRSTLHEPPEESAELLAAGFREAGEEMPEIARVFQEVGVEVSQNHYLEAVRYIPSPDPLLTE
jgi:hypothetical protein